MRVSVNGGATEIAAGTTVAQLLDGRGVERRGVAVAVNENIVPRSSWNTAVLIEGARVEILVASQGG